MRDIVRDADIADDRAVRVAARLHRRGHPAIRPLAVARARRKGKGLARFEPGDQLLAQRRLVVGVDALGPGQRARRLEVEPEHVGIGLVDELDRAVGRAYPHGDRRAVGDAAEALLALAPFLLRRTRLGHVLDDHDQPDDGAVAVAVRAVDRLGETDAARGMVEGCGELHRLPRQRLGDRAHALGVGLLAHHLAQRAAEQVAPRTLEPVGDGLVDELVALLCVTISDHHRKRIGNRQHGGKIEGWGKRSGRVTHAFREFAVHRRRLAIPPARHDAIKLFLSTGVTPSCG